MPGDYTILAPVYDTIGMGDFARRMTPLLMDYALHKDWLGRRIVVLGCGTGVSVEYLSQYTYTITGVDLSPEMLAVGRGKADPAVKWQQQDIRELSNPADSADMVLAINVMNELNSLRDLEAVFGGAHRMLETEKLFMFDMMTVQGLTEDGLEGDSLAHNDPQKLTVFATNQYDYERQMHTTQYLIFERDGAVWKRSEGKRILRAFPIQAVASLLQRAGFSLDGIYQLNMDAYDPATSRAARVVFVAEKH